MKEILGAKNCGVITSGRGSQLLAQMEREKQLIYSFSSLLLIYLTWTRNTGQFHDLCASMSSDKPWVRMPIAAWSHFPWSSPV